MTDMPSEPRRSEDPGIGSDYGSPYGTPGWVKAVGIIGLVVLLVLLVLVLTGGHSPGRHT